MKRIVYIIFTFLTLSFVMSCSRGVDKRLVLADTLMWTRPDSSLAILNAINRDSLQGDENQAYYALLLTQAQFRCNGNCTSDTLINSALDYYSDNYNREHYTRALLYKGAYYEERSNPVEAIKWYKQAEDNADTNDYLNLAQIDFRIGMLYYDSYISTGEDIYKFKKALGYYRKLSRKDNELMCLLYIGSKLRVSNDSETVDFLKQANKLAIELKDTTSIVNTMQNLSRFYLYDSCYSEAHKTAQLCISLYPNHISEDLILDEARACAKLGMTDSASMYISLVKSPIVYDVSHVYRIYTLADIALAKGDNMQYIKNKRIADSICDIVQIKRDSLKLSQSENIYNEQKIQQTYSKKELFKFVISFLICFIFIAIIVFWGFYYKKKKDSKRLIDEIRKEHISNYNFLREDLEKHDDDFSHLMSSQLNVFEEIMSSGYKPNKVYSDNKITHKIKAIDDSNVEFWNGLRNYLNFRYDGIIDKISKDYPILTDADINFIGLMCCDFSDAAIAVCKGYRNTDSVRSRRRKIRDKMKIDGLLDIYLKQLMKHNAT